MKKFFAGIFLFLFLFVLVSADGGFIPPSNYDQDIYEPTQTGLIVFDGSSEKLILQVSYESEVEDFAWVVPVPSYPGVEKGSPLIFNQISDLTKPIHHKSPNFFGSVYYGDANMIYAEGMLDGSKGVSLYEREWIDVFIIEIVSATDSESIYDWLSERDYSVSPKIKSALEPYVDEGWYFVIIRFNTKYRIYEFIDDVKKELDSSVISVQDASPIFEDYIVESLKQGKGYQDTKLDKITYTFMDSSRSRYSYSAGNNPELSFVDSSKYLEYKKYLYDEELLKKKIEDDLNSTLEWDSNMNSGSKNSGVFNPISIDFKSEKIVYPLRVSSMNAGVSEILLYILAPYKVEIDNFDEFGLEYAKRISVEDVKRYSELGKLFDQKYFVSKYRGELFPSEMLSDIVFAESQNNKEFVLQTYDDDYFLNWFLLILGLIFLYAFSLVACLFGRFISNIIIRKNKESILYVSFKRVFLQAFFLPFFVIFSYSSGVYSLNVLFRFSYFMQILNFLLLIFLIVFSVVLGFILDYLFTLLVVLFFSWLFSLFRKSSGVKSLKGVLQNK